MAKGGRRSDVESVTFTLTLDVNHVALLDRIVRTGLVGRSRPEAASAIIRKWLLENVAQIEGKYREIGLLPEPETMP